MALVLKDRVKETTTTTGTGTYTLAGAVNGFEAFSEIGNSNTTYYCCTDGTDFEVGIGTYTASGTTLARTTILQSSNSDNAVNWSSGSRTIFCTQPAEKAVFLDANGNIIAANGSALTALNASNLASGTVANARLDQQLQDVAGLAVTNGNFIVGDGSNFVAESGSTARTSLGLGTAAVLDTGISNTNVPKFTSGVADNDFLRVDGTDIEGRSASEVLSDIAAMPLAGGTFTGDVTLQQSDDGSSEDPQLILNRVSSSPADNDTLGTVIFRGRNDAGQVVNYAKISSLIADATDGTEDGFLNLQAVDGGSANNTFLRIGGGEVRFFRDTLFLGDNYTVTWDKSEDTLEFADNAKLAFGAGDDISLHWDGTDGHLAVAGTLNIEGSGETLAKFIDDGAVELYHNNSKKLETASGGVSVTGEVAATSLDISGDVDVDGTLEADAITLNGTSLAASATTDTTNASNIGSGTLPNARLDAQLQDVAGLAVTNGNFIVGDGSNFVAESGSTARTSLGLGTAAVLDTGISNTNVPKFTSGVADNDFLRVDGTAIEGRSASQVLSDIGGQASLTFGISNTNAVKIDSTSVADDEFARFTANGLESRSASEVRSDLGLAASATTDTTDASNIGSGTLPNARLDAQLQDVAGLAVTNGNFIVGDGSNFVAESGSTARASLGLGTIATQAADSVNIDGGAIDGVTLGTNSAITSATIDNIRLNSSLIQTISSNSTLSIQPNGTGNVDLIADQVTVGDLNANATLSTRGTGDLTINTNSGTNSGSIVLADGANGDISITPNGTGSVVIDGLNYPQADGSSGQFLKTDGSGTLSFSTVSGGDVVDDTSPQLGGVLDTNGNNIEFGDSTGAEVERLKFGAGDDLRLYHDGTDSFISNKTGNLYIGANDPSDVGGDVYIRAKIGENDTSLQLQDDSGFLAYSNGALVAQLYSAFIWLRKDVFLKSSADLNLEGGNIVFEGATSDANETTITATDPTADRTITLPDKSGTVAMTSDISEEATALAIALG